MRSATVALREVRVLRAHVAVQVLEVPGAARADPGSGAVLQPRHPAFVGGCGPIGGLALIAFVSNPRLSARAPERPAVIAAPPGEARRNRERKGAFVAPLAGGVSGLGH